MKSKHHHLQTIPSTQDWAKEHFSTFNLEEFHVVIAKEQTKGRGRFNRHWHSPKDKNAYVTYCFAVASKNASLSSISLVIGLSIAEAVQKIGLQVQLKWPNDLFISGKKAGGILVETQEHGANRIFFVGFGVNVNMTPNELNLIECEATSLYAETNKTWSVQSVTESIETVFKRNLPIFLKDGFVAFKSDFESISFLSGKTILFNTGKETIQGKYVEVNIEGGLTLELNDKTYKTFFSGEITGWE
jgi:BirA family transcriptional regulator, biotin operon repressor / biotin---[acetyl-CoA-carboxylase] ligase